MDGSNSVWISHNPIISPLHVIAARRLAFQLLQADMHLEDIEARLQEAFFACWWAERNKTSRRLACRTVGGNTEIESDKEDVLHNTARLPSATRAASCQNNTGALHFLPRSVRAILPQDQSISIGNRVGQSIARSYQLRGIVLFCSITSVVGGLQDRVDAPSNTVLIGGAKSRV